MGPVPASQDGYLQVVDGDDLIGFAARHDIVVRMDHSVGDFIARGMAVVSVAPAERLDDRLRAGVTKHFALGERRTLQQDASYGVRQIVDIALKALSPSSNDPTTAANCVDHLGAIVYRIAGRADPAAKRADRAGRLRLVARAMTFESITRHAFDQVRQNAAHDVAVTIRMLERLRDVGTAVRQDDRRDLLWTQATMLMRDADGRVDGDRAAVDDRMRALAEVVGRATVRTS